MTAEQDRLLTVADERLSTARLLQEHERYEDAISRAYYAMFHAAKALLLAKESAPRTHAGVASELGKLYRNEIGRDLTREFSRIQEKRERADYGDLRDVTADEAAEMVDSAETFVDTARTILRQD